MKSILLSGCVLLGSITVAYADCAEELARMGGGISKDGSMAPLQEPSAEGGIAKDGTGMPLNSGADVATSPADVQSQQEGGETAAEEAMDGNDEALTKAREALAAGDEVGCMDAIKGMSPS